MRTKNRAFSIVGFSAMIIVLLVLCLSIFAIGKTADNTYASNIPFALYKNGVKVDFKNDEHFVIGSADDLSLVFNEEVTTGVSIKVGGVDYSLSSDKKTVDINSISGVVELSVTIGYEEPLTYTHTISVGWTALPSHEGLYYLPQEGGWSLSNDDNALFQSAVGLNSSSMRIITKGVEYLSFKAIAIDEDIGWNVFYLGNVSTSTSTNSFSVKGFNNKVSPADSDYTFGSFILNYDLDVIKFQHNPRTGKNSTMVINELSTTAEYVTLNASFNSEIGRIFYYNSKGEKVSLVDGDNSVLKNFKALLYFESAKSEENVLLFSYQFVCGTYSKLENSYEEGIAEHSLDVYIQENSELTASFKIQLVLPQNTSSINVKQNGQYKLMTVENGETIEFDREIPTEVTIMAPALGVQENCMLYINGKKHTEIVSAANIYAYTFGELDYDRTFTFVYTKEGDYNPTQFEYTLKKITKKTIEDDIISEDSSRIVIENDDKRPYTYYSPLSADRVAYVPGKVGEYGQSVIKFTVYESGSFVFNYYTDVDQYTFCLISVGSAIDMSKVESVDDLDNQYGIGDPYSIYDDKVKANHGSHSWRKKTVDITVEGDSTDIYVYYFKLSPYDSYVDQTPALFAIADVAYYVGTATYNEELRFENSGSFTATANGNLISNGDTFPVGTTVTLSATPSEGNVFYGWIIQGELVSTDREYTFVLVKDSLIECVMQDETYYVAKDGKDFYTSLNEAVSKSSETRTIYMINDSTLTEDLVIPANVKVLMPYQKDDIIGLELGNPLNAGPQVSWANPQKYLHLTLTIDSGVTLVLKGEFVVGGVLFYTDQSAQGHTSGAYSQIFNDGSIVLDDGAYLDVNGLISGSGEIVANADSVINMPFIVNNFAGGTITLSYYMHNCFPFYNYALINIQCDYTLNYRSKLVGSAALYFSGAINTQDIVVINSVDERGDNLDGALFWLTEGSSITLSYENKSVNAVMGTAHMEDSGVTTATVHGNILMGEFSMQGFGSTAMILGLPYTFNYVVESDGVLTVPEGREYMLLPGSEILVKNGGVLDIDGGLYVLEGLIQGPLAGKYYPTIAQLRDANFAVSGMLINNGKINVNGSFAGIVQSTASGALLNVSESAQLSKTIQMGGVYQTTRNRVELSLIAKISGIKNGELSILEAGKNYKSYVLSSGNGFVLPSFAMHELVIAEGTKDVEIHGDELVGQLNQQMYGSFGIVKDDNIEVEVTLSIGAAVKDVVVKINGVNMQTDEKGEITLMLPINTPITYQSTLFDKQTRSILSWDDLSTIVLTIPKSVTGKEFANNELVYNGDGSVKSPLIVKGIVTFYDGSTEEIDLTYTLGDGYVQDVTFESDSYVIDYSDKVYVQKPALTAYIENVLSLGYSANLVEKATELYQAHNRLINGLSSEEVSYVSSKITAKCGEYADYQEIVSTFTPAETVYGDTTVSGEGTSLNGVKKEISLSILGDYTVEGGNIYVTYKYTSAFNGIEYTLSRRLSGVERKDLSVVAEAKTSVYGQELKALTATVNGLVNGDVQSDVFTLTKQSGLDVGEYSIQINKNGTKSAFYNIDYTSAKYTIAVKDVHISLSANNVMLSKANSLYVTADFGEYDSIPYSINVLSNGNVVAKYANGSLKLESGFTFTVGEYTLQAVNDNENYNLIQSATCTYSVVENGDYYVFDVNLATGSKVYNGVAEVLTASAKVRDTNASVSVSVKVNNSKSYEIKNVGLYTISVEADGYTYSTTYEITKKAVSINWLDVDYSYNGNLQSPDYTLVGVIDGESVQLKLDSFTNAGSYTISPELIGDNYVLEEAQDYIFVISPKNVTVTVNASLDIRISTVVLGSRMLFTVTQTDSNISSSKISYEIYNQEEEKVFTVNSNGIVSEVGNISVGVHKLVAVCSDTNYAVTCISAELNVVEDNNYYTLDVKYDGGQVAEKTYDGSSVILTVDVIITETEEIVSDVVVEYYLNNNKVSAIKGAGDYIIKVIVESGADYIYNYRVNAKELELEWNTEEYIYNGFEQKPYATPKNIVSGDQITLVLSDGDYVNAGSKVIKVTAIEGDDASNYILPENSLDFEILAMGTDVYYEVYNALYGKVEQTLVLHDVDCGYIASDKVYFAIYDGEELVGSIVGDEVSINRTLALGSYTIAPLSLDSNYVIENNGIEFYVVESKDYYSVNLGILSLSKTYDGNEVVLNVTAKVSQSRESVDFTLTVNGKESHSICDAGSYSIVVTVLGGTFEYEYVIDKKTAQISWGVSDFTYNGNSQIPTVTVINKGLDDVSVELNPFDSVSAGFKSISVKGLSGSDKDNYKLAGGLSHSYTIKKLEIDLTFGDIECFYGEEKGVTYSIDKNIPDQLNSVVSVSRKEGLTVGKYPISVITLNDNYIVNASKADFVIKPREVTVLIDRKSITYGDEALELTASINGTLVYGDTLDQLIELSREEGINVGDYQISGTANNENYAVTFVNAVYSIKARKLEVLVKDVEIVYGEEEKPLVAELKEGFSFAYDDTIDSILALSREQGVDAGEYKITASLKENNNYTISVITYSKPEYSLYKIAKRALTITLLNKYSEDVESYENLVLELEREAYEITEGRLMDGDNLAIIIELIYQGEDIKMTAENFDDYYIAGEHVITLTYDNDNYDITVINATLTVTKAKVNVVDIVTEYVYSDGNVIEVFNWKKNIEGNLKRADDKAFGIVITTIDGEEVASITNVGTYTLKIIINYQTYFGFVDGAETQYTITVSKKDISDSLIAIGVPEISREYDPYANDVYAECTKENINCSYEILRNGEQTSSCIDVGSYSIRIWIEDMNYKGETSFNWSVTAKDISNDITISGASASEPNMIGKFEIGYLLPNKYKSVKVVAKMLNSLGEEVEEVVAGEYKYIVTVEDVNYIGQKELSFMVIDNYDKLFENLENLLNRCKEGNAEEKFEVLSAIRVALKEIKKEELEIVKAQEDYLEVLNALEKEFKEYGEKVKEVADTANSEKLLLCIEMWNAFMLMAYMGIKETL